MTYKNMFPGNRLAAVWMALPLRKKRERDVRRSSSVRRVPSKVNRELEKNRRGKNPQPQAVEQRGRAAHQNKVFSARKKLRGGRTLLEAVNTLGEPAQELTAYSLEQNNLMCSFVVLFFGFVCFSTDTSKKLQCTLH